MQVQFFGGSLHNRRLTIAGEMPDLPRALQNPLGDTGEMYLCQPYHVADREGAAFVLQGYALTPDDFLRLRGGVVGLAVGRVA